MTYAQELTTTVRALVEVARIGHRGLTADDVPIAITGRRGVLELLTTVHDELTGMGERPDITRIGQLEAHPVAAFGQALARHPRPVLGQSPSEVFRTVPTSAVGTAWRDVARHALLAHREWSEGEGPHPDQATAWAGVGDLAAVARQVVALDAELAEAVATVAPHRTPLITALRSAATSGLAVTARESARLAALGPIAANGPDRAHRPQTSGRIVIARTVRDLPATQRQLAQLLDGAGHLRPERLPQLAVGLARSALVLAETPPRGPAWPAVTRGLREHARRLGAATTRPDHLASLSAGDPRPLRQAAEALQALRRHANALADDPALFSAYVQALAGTTVALSAATDRALSTGAWLIPDRETSLMTPSWQVLDARRPPPFAVLAVRSAAAHSATLHQTVATAARAPKQALDAVAAVAAVTAVPSLGATATAPRHMVPTTSSPRPQWPNHAAVPALRRRGGAR